MEKSKNIITVNALTKSFKNVSVLKGVDFEVKAAPPSVMRVASFLNFSAAREIHAPTRLGLTP